LWRLDQVREQASCAVVVTSKALLKICDGAVERRDPYSEFEATLDGRDPVHKLIEKTNREADGFLGVERPAPKSEHACVFDDDGRCCLCGVNALD
jgi:hypothetical protein